MPLFKVEITETLKDTFDIFAQTPEEAEKLIFEKYKNREIGLSTDNLRTVEISVKKQTEA